MGPKAKVLMDVIGGEVIIPAGTMCEEEVGLERRLGQYRACKYKAIMKLESGQYRCKFHQPDKIAKRAEQKERERKVRRVDYRLKMAGPRLAEFFQEINAELASQKNKEWMINEIGKIVKLAMHEIREARK